jgi:hypothetical protein
MSGLALKADILSGCIDVRLYPAPALLWAGESASELATQLITTATMQPKTAPSKSAVKRKARKAEKIRRTTAKTSVRANRS